MDTRATINDDVLNNIGTIEVVILRCQDDPKNTPVNPFDFPKLPVLTKPAPAVSNMSSKQGRRAASKKARAKELSNQGEDEGGLLGGIVGLFDGATDYPTGLDGHQDSRESRAHRIDDRSRRQDSRSHRYKSPRRSYNGRHRYLEEDLLVATSTDEEPQKSVHFESPVATYSRGRTSDRHRRPSSSRYARRDREEIHPFLLRSTRRSPGRQPFLDSRKRQHSDAKDLHTDQDSRRQSSPKELVRYLANGHDELAREQRRSGASIRKRSWSRSSVQGRGRSRSSDESERCRSVSSDKPEKGIDPCESEIYAAAAHLLQGVKQRPSKGNEGRREQTPSPSSTSVRYLLPRFVSSLRM